MKKGDFLFGGEGIFPGWFEIPFVMLVTTSIWVIATFITPAESNEVLFNFYKKIQPGGPGWGKVVNEAKEANVEIVDDKEEWSVPAGIKAMLLGCVLIYSCLFATGYYIYGEMTMALILTASAFLSAYLLKNTWSKIKAKIL